MRPGDSLSVRVGQLTVRVRPGEVLPLQQQHQQQGRSGKQTRSSSRPASGAPGLDASEGVDVEILGQTCVPCAGVITINIGSGQHVRVHPA